MKFSLIVPLWNEGKNVDALIDMIANSQLPIKGMGELILVDNGSTDDTGKRVDDGASKYAWIVPIHLNENQGYGGGIYEGLKHAKNDVLGYICGDLQVSAEDVIKTWQSFLNSKEEPLKLFVKGHRTVRHDPFHTRLVSVVYTFLANIILGLQIKDVNGLPKLFHRSLIDLVPSEPMKCGAFDAQLIFLARSNFWTIKEIPVTFHSRREGVSSWSGINKRLHAYINSFKRLLTLRKLRNAHRGH